MKKRIVLKIGTSTLTAETDKISYAKIEDIARQISYFKERFDIILVSSGSIATARQFSKITKENTSWLKQALSAIWQPKLIRIYDEVFSSFNLKTAQCLLTYMDFKNKNSIENTKNTIKCLLENNHIPIINENDTVAIDEIIVWDNDRLSALTANILQASILVIASDIDGFFDKNPHLHKDAKLIEEVFDISEVLWCIEERESELWTWWMTTKIEAVKIAKEKNIEVWIVNWRKENFLINAFNNKIKFTRFRI